MAYRPFERLTRIIELAKADPYCTALMEDIANGEHILDTYLEDRPKEESMACNALPTALRLYYDSVLALVSREMRFPDEDL